MDNFHHVSFDVVVTLQSNYMMYKI